MKRRLILGAAFVLALGALAPAVAQEKKAGETMKPDARSSTATGNASRVRRVDGVVKSVQSDGFVVSGKEAKKEREWAFAITDKTTMTGELKPGDAVTVEYVEQGGKVIAQNVSPRDSGAPRPAPKASGATK